MKILVKIEAFGFEGSGVTREEIIQALELSAKEIGKRAESKLKARSEEFDGLKKEVSRLVRQMKKFSDGDKAGVVVDVHVQKNEPVTIANPVYPRTVESNGDLSRPQARILKALAEFAAIGRTTIPRTWVAARAGASYKSSAFKNNVSALKTAGLLYYDGAGNILITPEGHDKVPSIDQPKDSKEMLQSCLNILSQPQQRILQAVYDVHPELRTREDVAMQAGASPISSAFKNNVSALKSAGMLDVWCQWRIEVLELAVFGLTNAPTG